ncbi:MAG: dihydrofolate reductase family protein [Solirubrobacterales bacterium]|nr:dihydrofolate reductase family protein [Solirubrobacterales bacterium]
MNVERLLPDPGETTVANQLAGFDPRALAGSERPYTYTNFALTVDGRATMEGQAGPIGSPTDTEMLVGLRTGAEAVMIGAGTLRVERYGRMITDPNRRALRERRGLPHDPLAVLISGRLDLPWDAPIFTCGAGRILIFTAADEEPPETATSLRVVRHKGRVDLAEALRYLRTERGIRSLLCEGGPRLHAELLAADLIDELFVTTGPKIAGGTGPGLFAELGEGRVDLELAWLLREQSELYARYRVVR